jgi:hypothetical protein
MKYADLITYGDVIPLRGKLNLEILKKEISSFKFKKYNSRKPKNDRNGLSITHNESLPGDADLESLLEINASTGQELRDYHFRDKTDVFYKSSQIQHIIKKFANDLGRSHILEHGQGGYFPPHRDIYDPNYDAKSMRLFVPLEKCNAPDSYFFIDEKLYTWEHGRIYFINTNKMHHFWTYNAPARYIVFNVDVNENTLNTLFNELQYI